jgi:hypothetical protein
VIAVKENVIDFQTYMNQKRIENDKKSADKESTNKRAILREKKHNEKIRRDKE